MKMNSKLLLTFFLFIVCSFSVQGNVFLGNACQQSGSCTLSNVTSDWFCLTGDDCIDTWPTCAGGGGGITHHIVHLGLLIHQLLTGLLLLLMIVMRIILMLI